MNIIVSHARKHVLRIPFPYMRIKPVVSSSLQSFMTIDLYNFSVAILHLYCTHEVLRFSFEILNLILHVGVLYFK